MTRQETVQVLAGVQLLWPHSNIGSPAEATAAWHGLLESFSVRDVELALRELAAAGREQAPPPGVVLKTLAERHTDLPGWDEAWREVDRLIRRRGRANPPRPEDFSHPLVAQFAIPAWRELCDGPAPGTNGYGTHQAQQREAYKAMAGRVERGVALEAVGAARRRPLPRAFRDVLNDFAAPALNPPSDQEAPAS